MAQMEFYFSDSEIQELFRYINSKGGRFIPDLLYESGKYMVLDTYQELKKFQQTKTVHFFLIDDITTKDIGLDIKPYKSYTPVDLPFHFNS